VISAGYADNSMIIKGWAGSGTMARTGGVIPAGYPPLASSRIGLAARLGSFWPKFWLPSERARRRKSIKKKTPDCLSTQRAQFDFTISPISHGSALESNAKAVRVCAALCVGLLTWRQARRPPPERGRSPSEARRVGVTARGHVACGAIGCCGRLTPHPAHKARRPRPFRGR